MQILIFKLWWCTWTFLMIVSCLYVFFFFFFNFQKSYFCSFNCTTQSRTKICKKSKHCSQEWNLLKTFFLHNFSNFTWILLFLFIHMYLSLLLKMINGFSWPEKKIIASPCNYETASGARRATRQRVKPQASIKQHKSPAQEHKQVCNRTAGPELIIKWSGVLPYCCLAVRACVALCNSAGLQIIWRWVWALLSFHQREWCKERLSVELVQRFWLCLTGRYNSNQTNGSASQPCRKCFTHSNLQIHVRFLPTWPKLCTQLFKFTHPVFFPSFFRGYHFLRKGGIPNLQKVGNKNFMTPITDIPNPLNRLKLYWNQSFWTKLTHLWSSCDSLHFGHQKFYDPQYIWDPPFWRKW